MIAIAAHAAQSGYRPLYRTGSHCPVCGTTSWHIGRQSAECARCATALPLAPAEHEAEGHHHG